MQKQSLDQALGLNLSSSAKLILLWLCIRQLRQMPSKVSQREMQALLNLGSKCVNHSLASLREAGLLSVKPGNLKSESSEYLINLK